jgi:hypothetical protein
MTKANSTLASRRALLQGAAAVAILAPAATIGAAAVASMPDPLIALCDKWRAAFAEYEAAIDRFNSLDQATIDAQKGNDPNLELLEIDLAEAEDARDAARDRNYALLDEIIATPPRTVEGLFGKLRLMADEVRGANLPSVEPIDFYERTYLQLADDVALLAGGAV